MIAGSSNWEASRKMKGLWEKSAHGLELNRLTEVWKGRKPYQRATLLPLPMRWPSRVHMKKMVP